MLQITKSWKIYARKFLFLFFFFIFFFQQKKFLIIYQESGNRETEMKIKIQLNEEEK